MDSEELKAKRKAVGERIRAIRVERGLSQRALANQVDIEQKQYWRLEAGENVTLNTLLGVLIQFEMSLEDFARGL